MTSRFPRSLLAQQIATINDGPVPVGFELVEEEDPGVHVSLAMQIPGLFFALMEQRA